MCQTSWRDTEVRTQELVFIFHSYLTIFQHFSSKMSFLIKTNIGLSVLELGVSLSTTLNLNYLGIRGKTMGKGKTNENVLYDASVGPADTYICIVIHLYLFYSDPYELSK